MILTREILKFTPKRSKYKLYGKYIWDSETLTIKYEGQLSMPDKMRRELLESLLQDIDDRKNPQLQAYINDFAEKVAKR